MTGPGCSKTKSGKHRKHTPITSEAQRKLFYSAASGKSTKSSGLSRSKAEEHLKEVEGKKLPARKSKYKRSK